MELAKTVLSGFVEYAAGYWTILTVLIVVHLICALWTGGRQARSLPATMESNAAVMDYFFRQGYEVDDILFQGRSGAEYILTRMGTATCVHIKWWNRPIGDALVQEIYQARNKLHCKFAVLISKEGFTRAAHRAARQTGVWLWELYNLEAELERFSAGLVEGYQAVAAARSLDKQI